MVAHSSVHRSHAGKIKRNLTLERGLLYLEKAGSVAVVVAMERCSANIAQEKFKIWVLHVGSKFTFKKKSVNWSLFGSPSVK